MNNLIIIRVNGGLGNQLFHAEMRHLRTDSDSEVLLNIFAHELGKQREIYPSEKNIFKAVSKTHIRCDGAYAVIALINGYGLVAFRDNNGIRPLSIGIRKGKSRDDYIISSEDALYTPLGYKKFRDVRKIMRTKNNFTNISLLVNHLDSYAEDNNYINTLNLVIEKNNFNKFNSKIISY